MRPPYPIQPTKQFSNQQRKVYDNRHYKENESVVKIQSSARGFLAKKRVRKLRKLSIATVAAVVIQKYIRRYLVLQRKRKDLLSNNKMRSSKRVNPTQNRISKSVHGSEILNSLESRMNEKNNEVEKRPNSASITASSQPMGRKRSEKKLSSASEVSEEDQAKEFMSNYHCSNPILIDPLKNLDTQKALYEDNPVANLNYKIFAKGQRVLAKCLYSVVREQDSIFMPARVTSRRKELNVFNQPVFFYDVAFDHGLTGCNLTSENIKDIDGRDQHFHVRRLWI